ncbi:golgin subfamily A member 2 [Protopterus annectens]|uniref:golgin subfamily A member 2 n=1 Tax=Protopterus annectens TaxID=7888 RepID=UPI001CFAF6EF|nr:golgin subfamily A member 2 [Protopterus annectens]
MADDSRQNKLASAKKKLKEFQQKNSPSTTSGAKKKKIKSKNGSRPDTPTGDRQSPDSIQNILKVLVSDINKSNGVVIPLLDKRKVYLDGEVANYNAEQLSSEAFSSNNLTNSSSLTLHMVGTPSVDSLLQVPDRESENESAADINNRALSSTESLRQLSEQLNGLVNQSTTYINGENTPTNPTAKELETRYQELALALDTSNLTNKQLSTKIDELKQTNQELMDQMQKVLKKMEEKAKSMQTVKDFLQVHIQTIGILVSEKSELQTALSHIQQVVRQKTAEVEDLNNKLQSSRQRIAELEKTLSSISLQQKQLEKLNKEFEKDRDNFKQEVLKLRFTRSLSETCGQNDEEIPQDPNSSGSPSISHWTCEFSSQSELPDINQQLQMALEEKAEKQSQIAQLSESVRQLHAERDQYAQKLQEEGLVWQQRVQQLSVQVHALLEEKEKCASQISELETSLSDLQNKSALLQTTESESSVTPPIQGPTDAEVALQEDIRKLQEEKEALSIQYQVQVRDNEQLSRLNQEQEERLLELEKTVQRYNEEVVDRQQILENMQSDKMTISRALAQNKELKEQLAELQNGFVKLTNENMELASVMSKSQLLKELQEQRDQFYVQLHQYTEAYQQLATEREALHKQYLQQVQLMDQLQHEEVQGKINIEIHQKELTLAKEKLELLTKENQEMKHRIGLMAAELETGDLARMQENLGKLIRLCSMFTPWHCQLKYTSFLFVHLQFRFTALMQEKVELKEKQEELEHRCIQLSGETDTIGEYIALYQSQRAVLKQRHHEKDDYINRLAQDKEEMKLKLAELQELVMQLVSERNAWYSKYVNAVQNPDMLNREINQNTAPAEQRIELNATDGEEMPEISLLDEPEQEHSVKKTSSLANNRTPHGTQSHPPNEDLTAKQIMQLLQEIQNPQARQNSFLGENPCIPFFYRADENDEVRIMVI